MVIVAGGALLVVMGLFGKVGAIFTTIPSPVVGGMFLVMFGVIAAAGVSNLQVYGLMSLFLKITYLNNIFIYLIAFFSL